MTRQPPKREKRTILDWIRSRIPRNLRRLIFNYLCDYWASIYITEGNDDLARGQYPKLYEAWKSLKMRYVRSGKKMGGDPELQAFRYYIYNKKVRESIFNPSL